MKSVRIIALRKDRKRLLEHLQDSALMQVTSTEQAAEGFRRSDKSSQLRQFERNAELTAQALKILDREAPEKKGLLDSLRGRREIDPDEIGNIAANSAKIIGICNKIVTLDKRMADSAAERIRIKTQIAQLEPWKKLDIPLGTPDTATVAVFIGTFPRGYTNEELSVAVTEAAPELTFEYEIFYTSSNLTSAVIYAPKKQKEMCHAALRSIGFTQPINPTSRVPVKKVERLLEKDKELEEKREAAKKQIAEYAKYRSNICDTSDYFIMRSEKYKVISGMDQTKHVFVLTGYVPEPDCEKLRTLCERCSECVVEFSDAGDDAPVKLKNNAFAEPAESIVTMYSPPSKDDVDPTPLLAFFFYFFFGMMFSDAGYGLLMVIACSAAIAIFKPDRNMRNNLRLFRNCGVATIIWGLVFGSIFGDAPAVIYNLITGGNITMAQLLPWPTLDTQKDALMIMIMSIGLGLVHILVGMACKFYVCFRKKKYAEAFFDTGLWMLLLVGIAVLAAGLALGQTLVYIGAGIALACAVGLILTQGRSKKGSFGKRIGGVASLYDITSYVSDLLSYSRLLALGLTTGVMAQVFNMLSTLMGRNVFGIIFIIVIFIAGHAITIGLNALGSYVHTMRLQYVEMFSKFYEGGGKPFTPFETNSKHVKTNVNGNN